MRIASGCSSQSRVLPSMSVKRNVIVPDGGVVTMRASPIGVGTRWRLAGGTLYNDWLMRCSDDEYFQKLPQIRLLNHSANLHYRSEIGIVRNVGHNLFHMRAECGFKRR